MVIPQIKRQPVNNDLLFQTSDHFTHRFVKIKTEIERIYGSRLVL